MQYKGWRIVTLTVCSLTKSKIGFVFLRNNLHACAPYSKLPSFRSTIVEEVTRWIIYRYTQGAASYKCFKYTYYCFHRSKTTYLCIEVSCIRIFNHNCVLVYRRLYILNDIFFSMRHLYYIYIYIYMLYDKQGQTVNFL